SASGSVLTNFWEFNCLPTTSGSCCSATLLNWSKNCQRQGLRRETVPTFSCPLWVLPREMLCPPPIRVNRFAHIDGLAGFWNINPIDGGGSFHGALERVIEGPIMHQHTTPANEVVMQFLNFQVIRVLLSDHHADALDAVNLLVDPQQRHSF